MAKAKMNEQKRKINTKLILPVVICSLLAVLIVFGSVMGIIALVKELGSVVSYGGITVDRGVASYLVSTFKSNYSGDDDKYSEALDKYIRSVVSAAYLFDKTVGLTAEDREWIDTNTREILDYRAENNVSRFNEISKNMGFTYGDFRAATELLYKARTAEEAIYGVGGSKLSGASNAKYCEDYLATYSHVKVIFIRTEDKFLLDDKGNRVPDGDGNDTLIDLTDRECQLVQDDIARIKLLIDNIKSDGDEQMSEAAFENYYSKYNDDPANRVNGYYFKDGTSVTEQFREEYPNMIDTALSMEIGEFDVSRDGETVCVIYKYAPTPLAYAASSVEHFFTDFYSGASAYYFAESLELLSGDVNVKDGFREIAFSRLEANPYLRTTLGLGLYLDYNDN
ncbi:MAG: hypothetical protein IKC87_01870 [Clostridia bacterium]|nr:hypothetical protein [Clostridia bacterium]